MPLASLLLAALLPMAAQAGEGAAVLAQSRVDTEGPPTFAEYSLPGGFAFHVTPGPGGFWYTAPGANRIGVFTLADGQFTEFPIPKANSFPSLITYCPDGNLWFTEQLTNKIARSTPTGTMTEFSIPTVNSRPFALICNITAPPDIHLQVWFTEANANQIGRADVVGDVATMTEFPLPTLESTPSFMTGADDGNIWFTEASASQVGKFDVSSGLIVELPLPSFSVPQGIAPGPDGMLYVTSYLFGNGLVGINPLSGLMTEYPIRPNSGPFNSVGAADGNQWFTEQLGNGIGKLDLVTHAVTEWDLQGGPSGIASLVRANQGDVTAHLAVMEPDRGVLAIAPISQPRLTFTKVGSPDPVHLGDELVFTFTVTNNQPYQRWFSIEDRLPDDLDPLPDQPDWPDLITRPFGNVVHARSFRVPSGESRQLELRFIVHGDPFRFIENQAWLFRHSFRGPDLGDNLSEEAEAIAGVVVLD